MKKEYNKIITIVWFILVLLLLWIGVTSTIAAFKNPKLTETELFLRIPKSFILNFKQLNKGLNLNGNQ